MKVTKDIAAKTLDVCKILEIRQVAKVVTGSRRISTRIIIGIGNNLNTIGIGIGKSLIKEEALEKAYKKALKNLITISLTKHYTIKKEVYGSYKAAKVFLKPIKRTFGICASKPLRAVCELCGIRNISGKQLGSYNIFNNVKATINALSKLIYES